MFLYDEFHPFSFHLYPCGRIFCHVNLNSILRDKKYSKNILSTSLKILKKDSIMFTITSSPVHMVVALECMQELVQLSKFFFVSIDEINMWIAKGGLLFMCMWLRVRSAYTYFVKIGTSVV